MLFALKIIGLIGLTIFCLSIPLMNNAKIAEWQKGSEIFRATFMAGIVICATCGAAYWWMIK